MFQNVGKSIKNIVKFVFIVEVILSVVGAIACFALMLIPVAIACLIIGPLIAWLSSLMLYGYGELIDTNIQISKKLSCIASNSDDAFVEEYEEKDPVTTTYKFESDGTTCKFCGGKLEPGQKKCSCCEADV